MNFPEFLNIDIAKTDISNASRGTATYCPLAMAINRNIGQDYKVYVFGGPEVAIYDDEMLVAEYLIDYGTEQAIEKYDDGGAFTLSSAKLTRVDL